MIYGGWVLKYVLLFLIIVSLIAYLYIHGSPTRYLATGGMKAITKLTIKEVVKGVESNNLIIGLNVSNRLNLLRGAARAPLILIESKNIPPKYLKLVSYDGYDGKEWFLSLNGSNPIVLNITYTINWRGKCLIVDALFRGSEGLSSKLVKVINSIKRVKYVTCLGSSEGSVIKLSNPKMFTLHNLALLPLPPNFVSRGKPFSEEGIKASALISLLTTVIPIPRGNSGNVTLIIDKNLRYLGIVGNEVSKVLIINQPPSSKYEIQEAMEESTYVGNICSSKQVLRSTCSGRFTSLIKDAICSKVMAVNYVTLGSALNRLSKAINSEVTYGSVDLSNYVSSTCKDYTLAFLFKAKKGTCIHYASALALALKRIGFNARVAVGLLRLRYVKLEDGKYASVYAPHAWVEVLTSYGYILYDPTPPSYRSTPLVVVVKELSNLAGPAPTYLSAEPYPGVRIMLSKFGRSYSTYYRVPWYYRLSKNIEALIIAITPYILIIGSIAIIAYLIMTHPRASLKLIAKLKSLMIRRSTNVVDEVINAVYGSLGLKPSKYLTVRELINNIKYLISEDLRNSLMKFLIVYERYRFGCRGDFGELVKAAKEVLSKIGTT